MTIHPSHCACRVAWPGQGDNHDVEEKCADSRMVFGKARIGHDQSTGDYVEDIALSAAVGLDNVQPFRFLEATGAMRRSE